MGAAVALVWVSSQQQSEALLAAARDAVIVVDDARTFVDVNPAASRLFGVSAPDLLGRCFDDFLEPDVNLETAWQSFSTPASRPESCA